MYFKILRPDDTSPIMGFKYPVPTILKRDGTYKPGRWTRKLRGDLEIASCGYHLYGESAMLSALLGYGPDYVRVFEAEGRDPNDSVRAPSGGIVAYRQVRLLRPLRWGWSVRSRFNLDCLEHAGGRGESIWLANNLRCQDFVQRTRGIHARDAERAWQTQRLIEYLTGKTHA